VASPSPIDPLLLPDLHFGFSKRVHYSTAEQYQIDSILASIMNRLIDNMRRDLMPVMVFHSTSASSHSSSTEIKKAQFSIQLTRNSRLIYRFDDLIDELQQTGHTIKCTIMHHVAVFGIGLCVSQGDDFVDVPVACFQRTGVSNDKGIEAVVPLHHSAILFHCVGPLLTFTLEYFHSVNDPERYISPSNVHKIIRT
jgi:hypothetical protein